MRSIRLWAALLALFTTSGATMAVSSPVRDTADPACLGNNETAAFEDSCSAQATGRLIPVRRVHSDVL